MKRIVSVDKGRAISLKRMADLTLKRLHSYDLLKYPSNTLNDFYDVIHQLSESFCSIKGIKFWGEGAHAELIGFVFCSENGFSDSDKVFAQKLRALRNRISYEGFSVKADFLERNLQKIEEYIKKLSEIVERLING